VSENFAVATRRWFPLAARLLGWRPDEFWRATPAELTLALADPNGAETTAPPTRETIARMMERDKNAGQV
jgi:uncharacterized phage protein (TIGR02216 family)